MFPTSKNSRFRPNSQRIFYISAYLFPIYIYTKRTRSDGNYPERQWRNSCFEARLTRRVFGSRSNYSEDAERTEKEEGEIGTKRGEIRRAMERAIEVDKERRKGVVRRRVFLASGGEL